MCEEEEEESECTARPRARGGRPPHSIDQNKRRDREEEEEEEEGQRGRRVPPARVVQLHVGTRYDGVRVEALSVSRAMPTLDAIAPYAVLRPENGFANGGVRVCRWGAPRCHLAQRRARVRDPDAEYDGGASSADEAMRMRRLLRRNAEEEEEDDDEADARPHRSRAPKRRRGSNNNNNKHVVVIELAMTDTDPDEIVYIWLSVIGDAVRDARLLPHRAHSFRIENTCGACFSPHALNLERYTRLFAAARPPAEKEAGGGRRMQRRRRGAVAGGAPPTLLAGADLITTLSGTFAPCTNHVQVDFRGVRSVRAMLGDWELISGLPARLTRTTVYMVVLKGCIGLPVLLFDHGMRPPDEDDLRHRAPNAATTATTTNPIIITNTNNDGGMACGGGGGGGRPPPCYLAQHLIPRYCLDFTQHMDVCQSIELKGIQWARIAAVTDKEDSITPVHVARGSAHVSRRGGVMLRLLFPRNTEWSPELEAATVRACDRFLALLRRVLEGRRPFLLPPAPQPPPPRRRRRHHPHP